MWCQGVTTLENEHTWLIFEDGDGGDGGRWLMGGNGGGVSHAYDMGGGGSWLMGGNGGRVVSCHVACLRHDVVVVSGRVVSCRVPTTRWDHSGSHLKRGRGDGWRCGGRR